MICRKSTKIFDFLKENVQIIQKILLILQHWQSLISEFLKILKKKKKIEIKVIDISSSKSDPNCIHKYEIITF